MTPRFSISLNFLIMNNYKKGQTLTYIPLNQRCVVVHNSLGPGGTNADQAYVTVVLKDGMMLNVPVAVQDEYLTVRPPKQNVKKSPWVLPSAGTDAGTAEDGKK